MNGTIYQLSVKPCEPFSTEYAVLQMKGVPEIDAKYPDPIIQANLSERVGMWYVWKHRKHDWVGFTSGNQLRKNGKIFQPGEIDSILDAKDVAAWGWIDLDRHSKGWTVAAQAEHCFPGFAEACKMIGLEVPRLTEGAYCNYFAMRWTGFDQFMRWSDVYIDRIIENADNPIFGKRDVGDASEGKDRHTTLGAIQERLFTIWLGQSKVLEIWHE
jgi:hypothetical protein